MNTINCNVEAIKNTELKAIENDIFNSPDLKNLSKEQLEQIAKLVIIERYKKEMNRNVDLMNYNYDELKEIFLNNSGRTNSINTRKAYANALHNFEDYLRNNKIENPLNITSSIADDYIYFLRNEQTKSNSTIRQYIGAVSSFYSFLERRSNNLIVNVFRGTKARPQPKTDKNNKFYNINVNQECLNIIEKDFNTILENINNNEFKTILLIMKNTGLRVGAFEQMNIKGNKFITETKGKEFVGILPELCLKALRNANIPHLRPFSKWTADRTKNLFKYHTNRLYKKGLIQHPYSAHDLRHFFAITEYNKDKDIYRVSKLLGHSSISVTEKYLKGLNVIE